MRRRRLVGAVVALIFVAIVVVAVDVGIHRVAEDSMARRIKTVSNARAVSVHIRTWSIVWSWVTASVGGVDVDLDSPSRDGLTARSADIHLVNVTFDRRIVFGSAGTIHAAGGTLTVELSVAELNRRLSATGSVVRLQGGDRLYVSADLPLAGRTDVDVAVDVQNGRLVLGLDRAKVAGFDVPLPRQLLQASFPLPGVPASVDLAGSDVNGDDLHLRFVAGAVTIDSAGRLQNG